MIDLVGIIHPMKGVCEIDGGDTSPSVFMYDILIHNYVFLLYLT